MANMRLEDYGFTGTLEGQKMFYVYDGADCVGLIMFRPGRGWQGTHKGEKVTTTGLTRYKAALAVMRAAGRD